MYTNSVCITNRHSENSTVGILTSLGWVRLQEFCRQNKLEWRWRSSMAPSLKRFARAYKTRHRWRFLFNLLKILSSELSFVLEQNLNNEWERNHLIFSLIDTLQSFNFHLPKWKAHQFVCYRHFAKIWTYISTSVRLWISLIENVWRPTWPLLEAKITCLTNGDMTHSQMFQKVEYNWGPIFKVVLEC